MHNFVIDIFLVCVLCFTCKNSVLFQLLCHVVKLYCTGHTFSGGMFERLYVVSIFCVHVHVFVHTCILTMQVRCVWHFSFYEWKFLWNNTLNKKVVRTECVFLMFTVISQKSLIWWIALFSGRQYWEGFFLLSSSAVGFTSVISLDVLFELRIV